MISDSVDSDVIDPVYMPFKPSELYPHFLVDAERQIEYYESSASRYHNFLANNRNRKGIPISKARHPCQIEKDEKFWTATTLKKLLDSPDSTESLVKIMIQEFGSNPPIPGFDDWTACFDGPLSLVLEAALPSPKSYVDWLRNNVGSSHFIPYVLYAAERANKRTLEGATHVDAIIINKSNGVSLMIEAKVLSDISYSVSFDVFRNQFVRTLDVLLEPSSHGCEPLNKRRPDASIFLLLTPQPFKEQRHSRLYGRLFDEYTTYPDTIGRDLPHRKNVDWERLSRKIGWLSFEQINSLIPDACPWIQTDEL